MGKKENLGKAVFEMFGVGGEKNKNVSEESTLVISEIPDPPPEKQKIFKREEIPQKRPEPSHCAGGGQQLRRHIDSQRQCRYVRQF